MIVVDSTFVSSILQNRKGKKLVAVLGDSIHKDSQKDDSFRKGLTELKVLEKRVFSLNSEISNKDKQMYLKTYSDLIKQLTHLKPGIMHVFLQCFTRIYTTAVDTIDEACGLICNKTENTQLVRLQGSLLTLVCGYCGYKKQIENELQKFEEGNEAPCIKCKERKNTSVSGFMYPEIASSINTRSNAAFITNMITKDKNCNILCVFGTIPDEYKKIIKPLLKGMKATSKKILISNKQLSKEWEGLFDYFCDILPEELASELMDTENTKKSPTGVVQQYQSIRKQLSMDCIADPLVEFTCNKHFQSNINYLTSHRDKSEKTTCKLTSTDLKDKQIEEIVTEMDKLNISSKSTQDTFEQKLKMLSQCFSEESIKRNVLEEVLQDTKTTQIDDSFQNALEKEIAELSRNDKKENK